MGTREYTADELRALLADADKVTDSTVREALYAEVIEHADPAAEPEMAVIARLETAAMFCRVGRWAETVALFEQCLAIHDAASEPFGPQLQVTLVYWYSFVIDSLIDFPGVSRRWLENAVDNVEHALNGHVMPQLIMARRRFAQMRGDWAAEDAVFREWLAIGGNEWLHADLYEWRLDRLLVRGDPLSVQAAFELMDPVLDGTVEVEGDLVPAMCHLLLPYARNGRAGDAVKLHRRLAVAMDRGAHRYEYIAMRMEFCALTGNPEAAYDLLSGLARFETFERPAGRMHYAIGVAVLAAAYIRAGRGGLEVPDGQGASTPMWLLHDRMRMIATELAAEFDQRNGSAEVSDRVRARLDAEPVTAFLPLRPGAVRGSILPPDGLSDRQLLDRARLHDYRCETEQAIACLAAVREPAGPLAAHVGELRARWHQSPQLGESMRWAIEQHRANGDERAALLAECWIGLDAADPDGPALTERAAAALRDGDDDESAGWAELWWAYSLVGQGRLPEALLAVRRGANRAGKLPLVAGVLMHTEAVWHNELGNDPALVKALAGRALSMFLAIGAGMRAIEAVDDLAVAHQRAGTQAEFAAIVDALLARPDAVRLGDLRGHLRHLRGRRLVEAGQQAAAIDDFYDAYGQAVARMADVTDIVFQLAIACYAADRFAEALEAGVTAGARMAGRKPDLLRFIMADSYDKTDQPRAALEQYEDLIDAMVGGAGTANPMYQHASAAVARLRAH